MSLKIVFNMVLPYFDNLITKNIAQMRLERIIYLAFSIFNDKLLASGHVFTVISCSFIIVVKSDKSLH